jgi:hypothetical protein
MAAIIGVSETQMFSPILLTVVIRVRRAIFCAALLSVLKWRACIAAKPLVGVQAKPVGAIVAIKSHFLLPLHAVRRYGLDGVVRSVTRHHHMVWRQDPSTQLLCCCAAVPTGCRGAPAA